MLEISDDQRCICVHTYIVRVVESKENGRFPSIDERKKMLAKKNPATERLFIQNIKNHH